MADDSVLRTSRLLTPKEVMALLRCSRKTLNAYVRSGALRYIQTGTGTKRPRRMFIVADVDEFIEVRRRKDVPCPSTVPKARRTITSTSNGEVIAFTARPSARPGAKRKR